MDTAGFRPDVFFDGAWEGWGVSRDLAGAIRDRFSIKGEGVVSDAGRHFRLKEDYRFHDGREDNLDWEIFTDDQGAFAGKDHINQVAGVGRQTELDYLWSFKRLVPTAVGPMTLSFTSRYFRIAADRVICTTKLCWWTLPIATLVSAYRRC